MKCATNLFLIILLCISLNGCSNLETSIAQTNEPSAVEQTTAFQDASIQNDNKILSEDYAIAEKALNKAVLKKNKDTIKLGLKSPIPDIRKKTVEAIAKIGNEAFVPNLIVALEQNQGIIAGGSEIQSLQNKLNEIIISTLEQLTKLKFNISKPLSPEDIKEVLDKTKDWCKTNKKVCEETSS